MKKPVNTPVDSDDLRRRAEHCLAKQPDPNHCEAEAACALMHELQVYVIELEMQNDELQEAQAQASLALERYTELYDFAPVGYLTLDSLGVVEEINLTAAAMLGLPRSLLIGQSLLNDCPDRQSFKKHLQDACHSAVNVTSELQVKASNGELLEVQLESRAIDCPEAKACKLRTIMTDITPRKRLEHALQQQRSNLEQLLQQQVAVQTAIAIAHELNQPLAAISLFSEVANTTLNTPSFNIPALQEVLHNIVAQSQRAGQCLHDLLEFLQKGEVATEALDLNDLIQQALSILKHNGFGEFRHVLDLEPSLRPVLANAVQIEKVLVNLIRNGVEAMRLAGTSMADITTTVRSVAAWNMAQVTVQDSGPGIKPEVAKRIFEPFYSTKATGIGMGLAISRALIEANGGQLWVDPGEGQGAIFHFTLPFVPEAE